MKKYKKIKKLIFFFIIIIKRFLNYLIKINILY